MKIVPESAQIATHLAMRSDGQLVHRAVFIIHSQRRTQEIRAMEVLCATQELLTAHANLALQQQQPGPRVHRAAQTALAVGHHSPVAQDATSATARTATVEATARLTSMSVRAARVRTVAHARTVSTATPATARMATVEATARFLMVVAPKRTAAVYRRA